MHASDEGGYDTPPPRVLIFMIKFSGCSLGSYSPLWQLVPINVVFGAESADETKQIERLGMHQMTIESTKYLE